MSESELGDPKVIYLMAYVARCCALVFLYGFAVQVATSTHGGPEPAIESDHSIWLRASKDGTFVLPVFIKLHKVPDIT